MKTIKGNWITPGTIVLSTGEIFRIIPYKYSADQVRNLLPKECYMLVDMFMRTPITWIWIN